MESQKKTSIALSDVHKLIEFAILTRGAATSKHAVDFNEEAVRFVVALLKCCLKPLFLNGASTF